MQISVGHYKLSHDKLVALPVPGDAYLLQRNGENVLVNVLVDGGFNGKKVTAQLAKFLSSDMSLDIVVCTHADADHAGGLSGLLQRSEFKIHELWLPGAWACLLPRLLTEPRRVVRQLLSELNGHIYANAKISQEFDNDLEATYAILDISNASVPDERESAHIEHQRQPNDVRITKESGKWLQLHTRKKHYDHLANAKATRAFQAGRDKVKRIARKNRNCQQWLLYCLDCINTAERIRSIAAQALLKGTLIRWFSFEEFAKKGQASGGIQDILRPLNAVELANPSNTQGFSILQWLTIVNRECLVFFSPGPKSCGVVFCGDSPLGIGQGYKQSFLNSDVELGSVVATAPHHGAESNAVAYAHLQSVANVLCWLRMGGTKRQPGATFRNLNPIRRRCNNCPHTGKKLTAVEILLPHGLFQMGHDCSPQNTLFGHDHSCNC